MSNRWKDWLAQAERDLEHVQMDIEKGFYEWACFSAEQAAEKALKAVYLHNNQEGWGHSVAGLLRNLPTAEPSAELKETAARLDHFYIPTRYANGFDDGAPKDYFFKADAEEAFKHARAIISFCKSLLAQ
jgi:HEPN domain-containing protein